MVVGLTQGPVLVYDTTRLFSPGSDEVTPLHSFPSTTSSAPRQILPNPGDIPELVAILRDNNGNTSGQLVEILDVQKLESVGGWRGGSTPDATPTARMSSCMSINYFGLNGYRSVLVTKGEANRHWVTKWRYRHF